MENEECVQEQQSGEPFVEEIEEGNSFKGKTSSGVRRSCGADILDVYRCYNILYEYRSEGLDEEGRATVAYKKLIDDAAKGAMCKQGGWGAHYFVMIYYSASQILPFCMLLTNS